MWVTDREVHLISLSSAKIFWARNYKTQDLKDLENKLTVMRNNGLTVAWQGIVFNVLHKWPLISLAKLQDGKKESV